jgi:uncharacterized DUF497 family protein
VEFEWDPAKAASNERKHGIPFEVAALVFEDDERIDRLDSELSEEEERWNAIGLADGFEIYVVYTIREEVIRLISARKASRHEREEYWNCEI